jgi:ribosomal protein L7/L12
MKLATKIAAGVLLGIGVPICLLATARLLDPKTMPQERFEVEVALITLGLPSTALGGWFALKSTDRKRQEERDRLQTAFYRLIRETNGHLTVLRFAMETGLDGETAKDYLNQRAKEFNAAYNVTEEGNLTYHFDLGGFAAGVLPAAQTETFDVVLEWIPSNRKRQAIKAIHELTGLDWQQVKTLIKRLPEPVVLQQGVPKDVAEFTKRQLAALGVEVLIVLN